MKVNELAGMFGSIQVRYINAWNGRGNTPSKGFSFDSFKSLEDAYGCEEVSSWNMKSLFDGKTAELTIRMRGTHM